MTARHHHYLSQCYLKGFTNGGSKKSKLTVFDFKDNKRFETTPRNVGGIRDFNRIDIDGENPNAIEDAMSEFEGKAAWAIRTLEEELKFDGEVKDTILSLIALLAVRSPENRENIRKFHADVMEHIMDVALSSKEMWESQIQQMKEKGEVIDLDITYEETKQFFDSKKYSIEVSQNYQIKTEFDRINTILPLLHSRNWVLARSTDSSGPFITTDHPCIVVWKTPDKIPIFYRDSPGYGMKDTQIQFPVSKSLTLTGEFDARDATIEAPRNLVANLNSRILMFAHKQIYAPKISFYFLDHDSNEVDGTQLLKVTQQSESMQTR